MKEPFRLDLLACIDALDRCESANEEESDEGGEPAGAVIDELARQLHAAGAPDAPFEEQARVLLAAHRALAEVGEEMPGVGAIMACIAQEPDLGMGRTADVILDLFRPLFARRTRERDGGTMREAGLLVERDLARQERDEARTDRDMFKRRTQRQGEELSRQDDELQALRQRADRAEQLLMAANHVAGTARTEIATLRARVTDLEASAKPGADVVERLAKLIRGEFLVAHLGGLEGVAEVNAARAVLSALAETGEEAWPTVDDIGAAYAGALAKSTAPDRFQRRTDALAGVAAMLRSRLAPVIGALRAELAAAKADGVRVAEEAREAARVALGERRELRAASVTDHVHELGSCSYCDAPERMRGD